MDPADLKPENVLICIDDVESIIQAELASSSANATPPPTRLVGVPPSRGRGGNQTPRSESVFITGSQPLPSPSSSYGASPMLDKWAFGMSKIDGGAPSKPSSVPGTGASVSVSASADTTGDVGDSDAKERRGLSAEMDQASERISQLLRDPGFREKTSSISSKPSGPSLLSQQAPRHPAEHQPTSPDKGKINESPTGDASTSSTSSMSLDQRVVTAPVTPEGHERITVKIADLGNGKSSFNSMSNYFHDMYATGYSNVGGASLHRRHSNTAIPLSRSPSWRTMGPKCRYMECCLCGTLSFHPW